MRTAIHAARCLLLSALLAQPAFSADKPSPIKKPDTKSLTGQVVDEAGRPVEGALVWVPLTRSQDRLETMTHADGQFELKLPSDSSAYSLMCFAAAGDGSTQGFYEPQPNDRTFPDSITISLKPARDIRVSVVGENGKPVPEADVQMFAEFRQFLRVRTDPSGRVVLKFPRGLPLHAVAAVKPGAGLDYFLFQDTTPDSQHSEHLPQNYDAPLEFKLTGAREVTVRVHDTHGKPVEGVHVNPWFFRLPAKGGNLNISGLTGQYRDTNAEGIATFDFIPARNDAIIFFWARKRETHKEQRASFDPRSSVDRIEVTMPELIPVRGRVLDTGGRPDAGADVVVIGKSYDIHNMGDYRTSATSNADGTFRLKLPSTFNYLAVARKERDVSPSVAFALKEEDPPGDLVLQLQPGTRIHGTVTVGTDHSPVEDQSVRLTLKPSSKDVELPQELQRRGLNDNDSHFTPQYVQSTRTDDKGRFEFLAGPGEYFLSGSQQKEQRQFAVDKQVQTELNLHLERLDTIRLIGRVSFKGQPDKPLARATIYVYPDGASARLNPQVKTDERGIFQCQRPYTPCIAYVCTQDKSHVAIARIDLNQTRLELQLEPASRATGRLVAKKSRLALPGEEIKYGIRVYSGKTDRSTYMTLFGGAVHTAEDGSFELSGLIPGFQYKMSLGLRRDNGGRPYAWQDIGNVHLDTPGKIDLGDVSATQARGRPTRK